MNKNTQSSKSVGGREKGVHIPLDFDTAMSGLLKIKPPKKAAAPKPEAKKAGGKKAAKKKPKP